jgi:hypothetical protein
VKWKTEDPKETERVRKGNCGRKRVGKEERPKNCQKGERDEIIRKRNTISERKNENEKDREKNEREREI